MEKRDAESLQDALNIGFAEGQRALLTNHTSCNINMEGDDSDSSPCSSRQRPKVPGLQRDIEVLKSELLNFITEYGQQGFMPMRKQLRKHGRVDIEKAITRMGGFRRIASLMNLSLAYKHRKPKGYWDKLENLQEEVCFQHLFYFSCSLQDIGTDDGIVSVQTNHYSMHMITKSA